MSLQDDGNDIRSLFRLIFDKIVCGKRIKPNKVVLDELSVTTIISKRQMRLNSSASDENFEIQASSHNGSQIFQCFVVSTPAFARSKLESYGF